MANARPSTKHLAINKANARVVTMIAIAAFIVGFTLVAARSLLSQRAYQARVIAEKQKAVDQLKANIAAVDNLKASYASFINSPENVLGGSSSGSGEKDGDNARIVLDALPSVYDFPALTTSLEKLLVGYKINSITGTDDEINQQQNTESPDPQPVEIPFSISVNGSYGSMANLVTTLDRSIRPFQILTINISGSDNEVQTVINAKTFYQPENNLSITKKDVQ